MSTPTVVKRRAEGAGQSKKHKPVVEVRAVLLDPAPCGLEVIATAATACPRIAHASPSADSSPTASSSAAPSSLPGPSSLTVHVLPGQLTPYPSSSTQRRPWLQSEDDTIRRLVSVHGTRSWELVAQECPGRTGKQCRERWHNHLDQNIKKSAWCAMLPPPRLAAPCSRSRAPTQPPTPTPCRPSRLGKPLAALVAFTRPPPASSPPPQDDRGGAHLSRAAW